VIAGFGERTRRVAALLRSPQTAFVIVTSPEPEPVSEAAFLAERLGAADMPLEELIVNRVQLDGLGGHSPHEVSQLLAGALGATLADKVASNLADVDVLACRDPALGAARRRPRRRGPAALPPAGARHADRRAAAR
jgi:anion-transporting  ArsA/GET3 family ATPase